MRQTYNWINYVSMAVYGLLYLVALAVAWLGWRRKRHLGYFVITVWALMMLTNVFVARPVLMAMSPFLSKLFSGTDGTTIMLLGSVLVHAASFLPLLVGLALLVFRENPPPGPGNPPA